MNQPTTKSSLSVAQRQLVELLQQLNFGRLEGLQVRGGQPVLQSARIVKKFRMGAENAARSESNLQDFWLKQQAIEMLQAISALGDGEVLAIEVKYGLPFLIEIEHAADDVGRLVRA